VSTVTISDAIVQRAETSVVGYFAVSRSQAVRGRRQNALFRGQAY
jgi:hypothetical protein